MNRAQAQVRVNELRLRRFDIDSLMSGLRKEQNALRDEYQRLIVEFRLPAVLPPDPQDLAANLPEGSIITFAGILFRLTDGEWEQILEADA